MIAQKIMEKIGKTVGNHPGWVVGVILLITAILVFPLMNLGMEGIPVCKLVARLEQ